MFKTATSDALRQGRVGRLVSEFLDRAEKTEPPPSGEDLIVSEARGPKGAPQRICTCTGAPSLPVMLGTMAK
jgi:hypothetical protein